MKKEAPSRSRPPGRFSGRGPHAVNSCHDEGRRSQTRSPGRKHLKRGRRAPRAARSPVPTATAPVHLPAFQRVAARIEERDPLRRRYDVPPLAPPARPARASPDHRAGPLAPEAVEFHDLPAPGLAAARPCIRAAHSVTRSSCRDGQRRRALASTLSAAIRAARSCQKRRVSGSRMSPRAGDGVLSARGISGANGSASSSLPPDPPPLVPNSTRFLPNFCADEGALTVLAK